MITYQKENMRDTLDELEPLVAAHYEEIAMYQDSIKLSPDWETYIKMEDIGIVHMNTVRDDGRLIGYYISLIKHNLHYKEDLYSACDVVFLYPEYRKGSTGIKLFREVESDMRALGVSIMTMHVKTDNDFSPLMKRLGWDLAEKLFTKCIKED